MRCSKAVTAATRGSILRTLLILAAIVPTWQATGEGFFHAAEPEVMAASARFDRAANLPYPSAPIDFVATAYCDLGITKSGVPVEVGLVAADPGYLPLGSWIYIVNPSQRGIYQVMDTGRLIRGKRIDIYLPAWDEAIQFGRQKIQVIVLKYGTGLLEPPQPLFGSDRMTKTAHVQVSGDDSLVGWEPGWSLLNALKSLAIWENSSVRDVSNR